MHQTFAQATRIASLINNTQSLAASLREKNQNKAVKSCETRWYTTIFMFESILRVKNQVLELLKKSGDQYHSAILKDRNLICDMEEAVRIMRPISICIAVAERSDSSISETIHHILKFAKYMLSLNWENDIVISMIKSFFLYLNDEKLKNEYGLIVTVYFLDRRYKMDYVTDVGIELVLKAIMEVASKTGYSLEMLQGVLLKEFECFCQQMSPFAAFAKENQSALEWWRDLGRCAPIGCADRCTTLDNLDYIKHEKHYF